MNHKPTERIRCTFGKIYVLPDGSHVVGVRHPTMSGSSKVSWVKFADVYQPRKLAAKLFGQGAFGHLIVPKKLSELASRLEVYASSDLGRANTIRLSSGGWFDIMDGFRMGDREIPSGRRLPQLPGGQSPVLLQAGTLVGWITNVAGPASHSSIAMLAIAAAFAAPTLKLLGIEAGGFGFNLFGRSGTGKSVALRMASSVFAPAFLARWNTTITGLEELVQAHCDLPTTLDSLEDIPPSQRPAILDRASYILTSGRPRRHGKVYKIENEMSDRFYRSVVISTEEDQEKPRSRPTGASVRLIDVFVPPNEAQTYGVVDKFTADVLEEKRRTWAKAYVEEMVKMVAEQHGTALPAFVQGLIKHRSQSTARLVRYQVQFKSLKAFQDLNSTQARMLDAFAQTYAAGRLAIDMKILPWAEMRLREAIGRSAVSAMENSANQIQVARRNAERVLAWIGDSARRPVTYADTLTWAEAEAADYIVQQQTSGTYTLLISDVVRHALGLSAREMTAAARQLREHGYLLTERATTLTYQCKIEGVKRCVYRVRAD